MKTTEIKSGDYNPYFKTYVDLVGDVDLIPQLEKQLENFPKFIKSIPEEKLRYSYAEGKWTVLEALQHVIDTERIFQYRALRFSRGDETPLMGFDQDVFIPYSRANEKSITEIVNEYITVRNSTLSLFRSFDSNALKRKGIASESPMSVGAIGFILSGHQRHHRDVIRDRYL